MPIRRAPLNIVTFTTDPLETHSEHAADLAQTVAGSMGVVVHGATAATARPSGYDVVTWIGTVEPTNATVNDIWENTSA